MGIAENPRTAPQPRRHSRILPRVRSGGIPNVIYSKDISFHKVPYRAPHPSLRVHSSFGSLPLSFWKSFWKSFPEPAWEAWWEGRRHYLLLPFNVTSPSVRDRVKR